MPAGSRGGGVVFLDFCTAGRPAGGVANLVTSTAVGTGFEYLLRTCLYWDKTPVFLTAAYIDHAESA